MKRGVGGEVSCSRAWMGASEWSEISPTPTVVELAVVLLPSCLSTSRTCARVPADPSPMAGQRCRDSVCCNQAMIVAESSGRARTGLGSDRRVGIRSPTKRTIDKTRTTALRRMECSQQQVTERQLKQYIYNIKGGREKDAEQSSAVQGKKTGVKRDKRRSFGKPAVALKPMPRAKDERTKTDQSQANQAKFPSSVSGQQQPKRERRVHSLQKPVSWFPVFPKELQWSPLPRVPSHYRLAETWFRHPGT